MSKALKGHQGFIKEHNLTGSRIYNIYCSMKQRCFYKKNNRFQNYGGRGITICDEWKNDFMSFYNWAMDNGYKDNLTIDRINNDGNYEPNNCRWVEEKTQAKNRRNNIIIEYNGKNYCLKDLCKKLNLKYATIYRRLKLNIPLEQALKKDYKQKYVNNLPKYKVGEFPKCCITMDIARKIRQEKLKYKDIAKKYNVSFSVVADIKKGKTYKETKFINNKLVKENE